MKRIFITAIALFALICSCEKTDPDLGEFQELEAGIDMSRHNQYDEKVFYNTWTLAQVYMEKYVDGVLKESADYSDGYSEEVITFNKDHSMVKSGSKGTWLYTHNFMLTKVSGGYYVYEVMKYKYGTLTTLTLRREEYVNPYIAGPFFKDNSGEHYFWVFIYTSSN